MFNERNSESLMQEDITVPQPEVVRDDDGCPYTTVTLRREWRKLQADFESTLSELYDAKAEVEQLKEQIKKLKTGNIQCAGEYQQMAIDRSTAEKAFALACRKLSDDYGCPAEKNDCDFPECEGETEACGDAGMWECWRKFFLHTVETEQVCRVCGCTQDNACPGGCYWVEDDLCSECAGLGEEENTEDI